ncbi:MAG: ankyrin repeat domain-containing protein, partial [Clostridiales bacterium]|nr:ankyrin repeat domain-containing protein [Clostridiales bacterium]
MIRTDKYKPSSDYPDRKVYDGQRTAKEVFDDLETHLTSTGYLPDEYFLFDDSRWGNGREFPSDGWLTNQVDYGGSEGIYLDITLEYQKNGERTWEHFATGKTLGETSEDLGRMNLISSAVTKAFHEDGVHTRYIVVGGTPAPEGVVISLNTEERRVVADSLAWHRESL